METTDSRPWYIDAIAWQLEKLLEHVQAETKLTKLQSHVQKEHSVWSLWGIEKDAQAHTPTKFILHMGFHKLVPCAALAPCAALEDIGKPECQSTGVVVDITYRMKQWSYSAKCCNQCCTWAREEWFGIDLPKDVSPYSILERLHAQLADRLNSRR